MLGITEIFAYDPNTGRETGFANQAPQGTSTVTMQWALYTWDQLGNLLNRNDVFNSLNETYGYDELNRLISITLPNSVNENSLTYDVLGNMLTKADVGTYTYPPKGQRQPHGVSSIAGSAGTTAVSYDSDGNVTAETGAGSRTLACTAFNMPQSITYAAKTISFQYDTDHNRVMQSAPEGTTYYLPDGEQTPAAVWHTYFEVDGQRIAEDYGVTGALAHHYFHNDDQNTIGLVTDDTFNVANVSGGTGHWFAQNEGSDVFGQPRAAGGQADMTWGAGDVTRRRWINQEDLADAHLIDLNARVYDPLLGKFLSPDPVIADQDDSQSWNAYAYAHNNPMSKEDPTGLSCVGSSGSSESCTVTAPPKPEQGNPGAAVIARPAPPGILHNSVVQAEIRAATQGPNSPAARSLRENGFMAATGASVAAGGTVTLTFGSAAEAIAVTGATANPVGVAVATIVFSLAPTSTSANDTTQGCGGPCDAPGAVGTPPHTEGKGGQIQSGPLHPDHGGTGDASADHDHLTGGTGKPNETGRRPPGTRVGDNGIQLRPGKPGEGPRIDIPPNGTTPGQTKATRKS